MDKECYEEFKLTKSSTKEWEVVRAARLKRGDADKLKTRILEEINKD